MNTYDKRPKGPIINADSKGSEDLSAPLSLVRGSSHVLQGTRDRALARFEADDEAASVLKLQYMFLGRYFVFGLHIRRVSCSLIQLLLAEVDASLPLMICKQHARGTRRSPRHPMSSVLGTPFFAQRFANRRHGYAAHTTSSYVEGVAAASCRRDVQPRLLQARTAILIYR